MAIPVVAMAAAPEAPPVEVASVVDTVAGIARTPGIRWTPTDLDARELI